MIFKMNKNRNHEIKEPEWDSDHPKEIPPRPHKKKGPVEIDPEKPKEVPVENPEEPDEVKTKQGVRNATSNQ